MKLQKMTHAAAALAALCAASVANAGSTAAGPAAGPAIVGSTVVPATDAVLKVPAKDRDGHRLAPGQAGAVVLVGEELINVRNALTASANVSIEGAVIRVPTMLGDGASATIVLDTQTGQLLVVRQ